MTMDADGQPFYFDQKLLEPYNYICQVPGKQIRSRLINCFNYWLKVSEDKLNLVSEIIELLHNSSLIIDDIEDNSKLRRGVPVAHAIYGVPWSINAANYAYFIGLQKTNKLNHSDATKVYAEQLLELHRGQGMDIWFRDNFICPEESDYKVMVSKKTGGLFGLAVKLMQLFSDDKRSFQSLFENLGLLFQIRDDYANLCSEEYADNKSFCEDFTEGKFSFPVIHAIKSNPTDTRIFNIVKQRTHNVELKKYAIGLLKELGSLRYTEEAIKAIKIRAIQEIENAGGNPELTELIHDLCRIVDKK